MSQKNEPLLSVDDDSSLPVENSNNFHNRKGNRQPKGKHPLEIEYWHVLPAMRRELAESLKEKGLKQREISEILGITEAAVSQYIKGSRGRLTIKENGIEERTIAIPTWLETEIESSTCRILEKRNEGIFIRETNKLMQVIRSRPRDFLCGIHEAFGEKVENCEVCFEE